MSVLAARPPETAFTVANVLALREYNPHAARAIESAQGGVLPRFFATDDGVLSCEIDGPDGPRALASRRRPLAEATKLAEGVDLTKAGVVVINGFGLGYHVREIARKADRAALVLVYEPDIDLLASVLARIDHSPWLGSANIRLLISAEDRAAMAEAVHGCEGLLGMGVQIVDHVPSQPRLQRDAATFRANFMQIVDATKLTVLTSLVQVRTTLRNATQNLDRYVESSGVDDLKGACAGRAGIVISAGPSLARNVHLLTNPMIRDRCVLVAVQTCLKTLLSMGIRPHFVTALDHSEISRRFYEGLTASDVAGITLIAEPKVNPAVLEAWPGNLRTVADKNLDAILGPRLAPNKGTLPAGATVAHLAYYVARHLGCDPVALIGQDLGFTDGQYYAAGAAIHNVWACELNAFNTLEMMEWQRIVRMGAALRRVKDFQGRSIFTDEQMVTYLAQFERDFREDAERGLTTIDASEGGVAKQNTRATTLLEFLEEWGGSQKNGPSIDQLLSRSDARPLPISHTKLLARVEDVRAQIARVEDMSTRAGGLLSEVIEHHADQPRVNGLIKRLEGLTSSVIAIDPGYRLCHTLAQAGAFNRVRSDRLIHLDADLDPLAKQKRQALRDQENVRMLAESAAQFKALLDDTCQMLRGGKRVTNDRSEQEPDGRRAASERRVCAVIPVLAAAEPRQANYALGTNADAACLPTTIERVRACRQVDRIAVVTDVPARVRELVGEGVMVIPVPHGPELAYRRRVLRAARAAARSCWRGGIAGTTAFDEVFDPVLAASAMDEAECTAVTCIGPDWTALNADITDQVIARYRRDPEGLRTAFSQAAPGLAPAVLDGVLVRQLAQAAGHGLRATIGALLGYNQQAPVNDLIASTRCVNVPVELRDARRTFAASYHGATGELMIDLADDVNEIIRAIEVFAVASPEGMVTFGSSDSDTPGLRTDPIGNTSVLKCLQAAARAGLITHVRTELTFGRGPSARAASPAQVRTIAECGPSIISIDLHADTPETYAKLTGRGDYERVVELVRVLLDMRETAQRGGGPLIVVPRITRCDAVYEEIETFYHRWLHLAGWAVIDAINAPRKNERIGPIPLPASAATRIAEARRTVSQVLKRGLG